MPNDDLISRKALYAAWDEIDEIEFNDQNLRIDEMIRLTQDAPAVDAEPVRHGRWVNPHMNKYGHPCHNCSECGFQASQKDRNYCPNCGAKMDKRYKHGK